MSNLKWYSGGDDRRKRAEAIITELLEDLELDFGNESLQEVLRSYLRKFKNEGTSIPLVLSRMNLEISNAIRKDGVSLNENQSKKLKELTSISNIRYGYY
ncbi:bacteriocin immunity protein [Enterococcus hirae]